MNALPIKTVVILENRYGLEKFLNIYECSNIKYITIISTSPYVCYQLDKLGYPYNIVEEYSDEYEAVNLGMENLKRSDLFCSEIDGHFNSINSVITDYNLKPGHDNFFFIKLLFDSLTIRVNILLEIIIKEKPDKIITFQCLKRNQSRNLQSIPYSFKESIYDILLRLPEFNKKMIHETYKINIDINFKKRSFIDNGINLFINKIKTQNQLSNYIFIMKKYNFFNSLKLLPYFLKNSLFAKKNILSIGFTYNWEYIIPDLYMHGYSLHHYYNKETRDSRNESMIIDEERIKKIMMKYCNTKGVNYSEPFFNQLFPLLNDYMIFSMSFSEKIDTFLNKLQPLALIFGTKSTFQEHILAHIGKINNIPVVSWQHGASELNNTPVLFYNEVVDSDIHLCFGDMVLRSYTEKLQTIKNTARLFSVGSLELESLFFKNKSYDFDFTAVYVTTNYMENHLYIGYPSLFQDNILWNTQKNILNVLAQIEGKIALKMHPSDSYDDNNIIEYISDNNFTNISIFKRDVSFSKLLEKSDIIIIDFPSTTLLQALARHKVVFVLMKHFPITDEARILLQKCAYCYDEIEDFIYNIRLYLNGKSLKQNPNLNNTEFLEKYGLYKTDGKVAKRAIDILDSKIMENQY